MFGDSRPVPLPRRPLDASCRVRRWYENELGWPTVPGDPLRLVVGVRFDVLDVPVEAGHAALRRLAPGSPVALLGDRMRFLVAAGTAEELPGLLEWLEWGTLPLDLTAIGTGPMAAPRPPWLDPPQGADAWFLRGVGGSGPGEGGRPLAYETESLLLSETDGSLRRGSGGLPPDETGGPLPCGAGTPCLREAGGVLPCEGGAALPREGGGLVAEGGMVSGTGWGRQGVAPSAHEADGALSPESGFRRGRPLPLGRFGSQGAAMWLRPPEPGCEVEASLPTLSALGGGGDAPDLVRLVNTVATQCHRVRLRRAPAQPSASRAQGR